ncbi:MAG: hypothetical protein QRY74_00080 [Chlamydia sp.]
MKLIAILLFLSIPLAAEELSIEDVMSKEEIVSTGLSQASPKELLAFSKWIEKWTKQTIQQAPSYHSSEALQTWIKSWPLFMQSSPKASKNEIESSRRNSLQKIYRNMNGKLLRLQDGSLWKIIPFDQVFVKIWQRDDLIEIRENSRDRSRPYTLLNITKKEQAGAILEEKRSLNGEVQAESSPFFANAEAVLSIDMVMNRITLTNGSIWKIAPIDHVLIQNNWRVRDRIQIDQSQDAIYRHRMSNLDSGDFVLAIQMQSSRK